MVVGSIAILKYACFPVFVFSINNKPFSVSNLRSVGTLFPVPEPSSFSNKLTGTGSGAAGAAAEAAADLLPLLYIQSVDLTFFLNEL